MTKALFYRASVALALISGAPAQQAVISTFAVLPPLPRPGEPFPEGEYLFHGPTAYEITVIYPDRASDGRIIGVREQLRIPLGNRVRPEVECDVTRRQDGQYVYRYAVANGFDARDSIGQWSLRLPWDQGEVATSPRWKISRLARPAQSVAGTGVGGPALQASLGHPDKLTWSLAPPIRPGEMVTGFTIVSPFAPGMTKAYASSGELPQYPAGFPKVGKAADFAYAMRAMANQGQVDSGSLFVTQALSLLSLFLESEGNVTIAGSQPEGLERAAAKRERQFARALRLAFQAH